MNPFKNYYRDFLTYTRTEKRGIFLMILILISGLAMLYVLNFLPVGEQNDFSRFKADVDNFYALLEKDTLNEKTETAIKREIHPTVSSLQLFDFDPNNLPDSLWIKLGLSEKQISSIRKYEHKGGRFRTKEDVKKMYVISNEMYSRIEPYIRIENGIITVKKDSTGITKADTIKSEKKKFASIIFPIDINTASTIELEMLPGIGPSKAQSVFKYKVLLGGYINILQLKEAYGITDSVFDLIKDKVFVTPDFKPVQINVNAETKEMLRHPYMPYKLSEIIVTTKKKNGNYTSIDDLRTLPMMKAEIFNKLKPYVKVE